MFLKLGSHHCCIKPEHVQSEWIQRKVGLDINNINIINVGFQTRKHQTKKPEPIVIHQRTYAYVLLLDFVMSVPNRQPAISLHWPPKGLRYKCWCWQQNFAIDIAQKEKPICLIKALNKALNKALFDQTLSWKLCGKDAIDFTIRHFECSLHANETLWPGLFLFHSVIRPDNVWTTNTFRSKQSRATNN